HPRRRRHGPALRPATPRRPPARARAGGARHGRHPHARQARRQHRVRRRRGPAPGRQPRGGARRDRAAAGRARELQPAAPRRPAAAGQRQPAGHARARRHPQRARHQRRPRRQRHRLERLARRRAARARPAAVARWRRRVDRGRQRPAARPAVRGVAPGCHRRGREPRARCECDQRVRQRRAVRQPRPPRRQLARHRAHAGAGRRAPQRGAAPAGALCAAGAWPTGLDVTGRDVPLALVVPYLPERGDGRPWLLHGEFTLDAQVRSAGNGWRGEARLASAAGGMKNSRRARSDLVSYRDLVLDASFDPQRIEATLGAVVNEDGRLDATLATGWDGYAPLQGEIDLRTDELTWMELLSPDIVEPTGTLAGHVTLGGTRAEPTLGGNAQLSDFATEIPALAIHPSNGNVRLDALPDGSARITGSIQSGEGTLNIDGSLGWRGDDTPLVLNVRGSNVLASDTRDLRAVVNPDVAVRYAAGEPLQVSGTVVVPSATIDLERLDRGASVSPDVVILDPEDPDEEQGLATPLALDLTLQVGDDVVLNG